MFFALSSFPWAAGGRLTGLRPRAGVSCVWAVTHQPMAERPQFVYWLVRGQQMTLGSPSGNPWVTQWKTLGDPVENVG
jgi:hypothetical protein